jgi:hypothetical protein
VRRIGLLVVITVMASPLFAAARIPYRAQIRGGGGSGKCTIEIEVDSGATVEITGDRGVLNSPNGRAATWRRFQCNQVMPRNPNNFRFRGIDGRGRQDLVRQPNGNGGTAVVRITDTGSGREGYTFDLEWNGGGGGGYPGGGGGGYYPPPGGGGWGGGPNFPVSRAIQVCQDYVRGEARNRYGVRNATFEKVRADDGPGRNDWIVGRFRSNRGDRYQFSCQVNFKNGNVRTADITRGGW